MTNTKISFHQLSVLLVLSRIFSEGADLRAVEAGYSMQRFTVIAVSGIILFLLYLPLIFLANRHPSESVISIITGKSKVLGWVCGLFIVLSLLTGAVSAICSTELYSTSTVFGEAPLYLLVILPLAVCGIAAWKGIQGSARSGVLFGAVFVTFIVFIIISVWERFNWEWLYPAFLEEPELFFGQVVRQLGRNSELLAFAVLMEYVDTKTAYTVFWYIPSVMILQALKLLLQMIVLGPFLDSTTFPFFTISALSDIVLFQRIDGINVSVWILMCVVRVTVALLCTRTVFTRLVGERTGKWSVWAGAAIVALASLLLGGSSSSTMSIDGISSSWIILLTGGVLIPIIALIAAKIGRKREGEAHEKSS